MNHCRECGALTERRVYCSQKCGRISNARREHNRQEGEYAAARAALEALRETTADKHDAGPRRPDMRFFAHSLAGAYPVPPVGANRSELLTGGAAARCHVSGIARGGAE